MKSRLNVVRTVFLVLFILAALVTFRQAIVLSAEFFGSAMSLPLDAVTMIGSIMASVIALLGFVVTTVISLRKDKRDARESELSLKQKELELEKARLELEQLKAQLEKKKK